ncbi:hypothetical protein [Nesterenkonia rhizosphaerae]|uniref:Uncharacterized protein n=1 Tax=Nesterenkonia rhizosphaerae TaxID=1348272 RepID=A0ABP9G671_9MICC
MSAYETVRAQNIILPVTAESPLYTFIGHPVRVAAGERWIWIAECFAMDFVSEVSAGMRAYWTINGVGELAAVNQYQNTQLIPAGTGEHTVAALITVPAQHNGQAVETIQPTFRNRVASGAVFIRNLVSYRIS